MGYDDSFEINEQTLPVIKQLAERMPGGFFVYHADGDEDFILFNRAMLRLTECETEEQFLELTGNSFRGFVHPDDLQKTEDTIIQQIAGSELNYDYVEYRIVCRDGQVKWVRDYGHLTHTNPYGDVYYVFVDDATEMIEREIQLQLALENQEAQLQEIMELNKEIDDLNR